MLVSPPPQEVEAGVSMDEEPVPPNSLTALTEDLSVTLLSGGDVLIRDVVEDSRAVRPGALFVACPGVATDGAAFIHDACDRGAVAVLTTAPCSLPEGCHGLIAEDPRQVGLQIAQRCHGHPADQMHLIAVTGTNGKTTTAYLIRDLLEASGIRCGLISGIAIETGGRRWPATLTTPQGIDTARIMAAQVADGCVACVMEASSHGLEQGRMEGLSIDAAIFTNLSGDHLDYHDSMEAYANAKRTLFDGLGPGAAAITNIDDSIGEEIVSRTRGRVVTCSCEISAADLYASDVLLTTRGTTCAIATPWGDHTVTTPLLGLHNVSNVMEAIAAAHLAGAEMEQLVQNLSKISPPPGRMERVSPATVTGPTVIVDFAHTDGALAAVCTTLAALVDDDHRFHVVFGCGGDRDRGKRPRMAQIACDAADVVRLTSDNPRSEHPEAILDDVASGVPEDTSSVVYRDRDRRRTMAAAISEADDGDVVLIAGKGHEPGQLHDGTVLPMDDRRFARLACQARREGWALTPRFLLAATGGRAVGNLDLDLPIRIATDTREDVTGALFWAIKGDVHDGHDHLDTAMAGGAAGVVVDDPSRCGDGIPGIVVPETREALGWAAHAWRSVFQGRVIAITGTSGKTTTKDLLGQILSEAGATTVSPRSFNNDLGVPLTILSAPADGAFLVVEVGVNAPGEMAPLAAMIHPDVAIVTSIGEGHLEGLSSVEGVAEEKYRLLDAMAHSGVAIVADSDHRPSQKVILVGDDTACDRQWPKRTGNGAVQRLVLDTGVTVTLALPGGHNAHNAALAAIAAEVLGVAAESIKAGLESAQPSPHRSQIHRIGSITVIEDCYNANPHSMLAALNMLQEVETQNRRVAVLGDMLELGDSSGHSHQRVIAALEGCDVDAAVLVGDHFNRAAEVVKSAVPCGRWRTLDREVIDQITATVEAGDTILIKGSRAMALEQIMGGLRDRREQAAT